MEVMVYIREIRFPSILFIFYPKRFYAVKQTSLRRHLSED